MRSSLKNKREKANNLYSILNFFLKDASVHFQWWGWSFKEYARGYSFRSVSSRDPWPFPHQHGTNEVPAKAGGCPVSGQGWGPARQLEGRQEGGLLCRWCPWFCSMCPGQSSGEFPIVKQQQIMRCFKASFLIHSSIPISQINRINQNWLIPYTR